MGINYSKIMCSNTPKKCAYTSPIPYKNYSENMKGKTPHEVRKYVCGSNDGEIIQCCDPFDPFANEVVKDTNLIKVIRDNDGNYKEFYICHCSDDVCQNKYCKNFKLPTQYEKCKARAVNKKDELRINPHVTKIVASNTYMNCYQTCKFQ
jgi:hypothetical protein